MGPPRVACEIFSAYACVFNCYAHIRSSHRSTRAKMEVNKEEEWNPIIQDVKKGNLR